MDKTHCDFSIADKDSITEQIVFVVRNEDIYHFVFE